MKDANFISRDLAQSTVSAIGVTPFVYNTSVGSSFSRCQKLIGAPCPSRDVALVGAFIVQSAPGSLTPHNFLLKFGHFKRHIERFT
jgi:hypothetical protein